MRPGVEPPAGFLPPRPCRCPATDHSGQHDIGQGGFLPPRTRRRGLARDMPARSGAQADSLADATASGFFPLLRSCACLPACHTHKPFVSSRRCLLQRTVLCLLRRQSDLKAHFPLPLAAELNINNLQPKIICCVVAEWRACA